MKGIIRLDGKVTDITYQRDSVINITLCYTNASLKKDGEEWVFIPQKKFGTESFAEFPYSGAGLISDELLKELGLPEGIEHPFYGEKTQDIHVDNEISLFLIWHRNNDSDETVVERRVVRNHSKRPEQEHDLIRRLIK